MLYRTVLLSRGWLQKGFQALAVATLAAALALFAGPAAPARAATLIVDPATPVDPTCSSTGPFKTIQRAIDCATAGDEIQVAAGTYNEDVTINKALYIQGAGIDQSIILGRKEAGPSTLSFAANDILVDGFTITRDGNNPTDWVGHPKVNGVTMQGRTGNTLQNCKVTGNRNGVYLNNAQGNTVKNNLVVFNRTGFQFVNNASNNVIQENEITDNWTLGVLFNDDDPALVTTGLSINNNNISGNWYGDVVCRWPNSTAVLDLSGNWFGGTAITKSNADSSEPVYADLIPEEYEGTATNPGGAVTIGGTCSGLVDYTPWLNSGADTGPGIGFQGDFSALNVDDDSPQSGAAGRVQEGVNLLTSGGSVSLRNGLYLESNIAVNKAATIAGESKTGVILAPAGEDDNQDNSFGGTVQHGFIIQEDGVTIRNLTIDGQGNAALTAGKNNFRAGILTDSRVAPGITFSNLTFQDLVVKNIFRRGIQLSRGGSSNLIADNTVSNVSGAAGSYAIASFAGDAVISGNTVSGSYIGIAANGLYQPIDDYPLLTIQGNTLTNNPIGMNLAALEDGSIIGGPGAGQGNSISTAAGGDDDIGLLVTFAHGAVTVQQNTVQGSASDAGLWLFRNEDVPVQILGNTFSATASSSTNPGHGTAIFMTDDHTLLGENNTGAGLAVIAGNTITGFFRGIDLFRDGTLNEGPKPLQATIGGPAAGDSNTLTGPATPGSTGIRIFDEDGPLTANATASIINNNASITNFETGIRVDGGLATIQKNAILTNSTAVLVENSGVATVTLNSIAGNTAFGVNNTTGAEIDANCNWWGSPTGPTHAGNPGATGDKASDDTAYIPWAGSNSYDCAVKYAIPTRLVFSTQPGDGMVNSPFSPQPVVRAEDDAGNLGYNFSGPVTLALSPAGANLQGTNPLNGANGVVTFNGLSVDATGTYTLTATAAGLAGATSSSFVIGQHPPLYLPLVTKP